MASTDDDRGRRPGAEPDIEAPTENSPLLPSDQTETTHDDRSQPQRQTSARRSLFNSLQGGSGKSAAKRRWPSILALLLLCVLVILIIVFAFLAPSTVEQYAQQAVVFDPTSLSIDSFTSSGVRARIQGNFVMDASRVRRKPVRDLGKFFTYVAREAESGDSEVEVLLPEYGNVVLGTAHVPGIKVDLRNGHKTHVDFLSDLEPGDVDGIRRIANDWIDGRLGQLRVLGKASVPIKSGIFSLGKQKLQQELLFANKDIPSIPSYDIKKLNFQEIALPSGGRGMEADVSLLVQNDYPVDFTVPPLAFNILVPNCHKHDPYIKIADAETHSFHVHPNQKVELNVTGIVHQLPDLLTQDCPGTGESPLDHLLGNYLHGLSNTVYVRGSSAPQMHTPQWVTDLIADLTVPVPLPGRTLGHLIKNFSLTDTHFSLPDPFAEPNAPESNPRISANVKALIALPEEMNFNISVSRVRADADVFYHGKKLGRLDLRRWQPAKSSRLEPEVGEGPTLAIESAVKDAPLRVTDQDVFTDVIQDLLFGRNGKKGGVVMHIKASVDVELTTALGDVTVREIPAEGEVPVKPISPPDGGGGKHGGGLGDIGSALKPSVFGLTILETSPTSLTLSARVNITNPTEYSASIPYIDIHIAKNGSTIAHATARDLQLKPGNNSDLLVTAVYDPITLGGREGKEVGRELLSQYISGWNTTFTLKTHEGTLPGFEGIGKALSKFEVEMPTPRLHTPSPPRQPGDDDPDHGRKDRKGEGGPHFIEDATFHLITSTATFTLLSPLSTTILYITSVNATALYKGEDVGHILYDLPFAVPPVDEDGKGITTPRLPVDWSLGSVGYEAVKRALGGRLKLGAFAKVGVRLGEWEEEVWFAGRGIGAGVRL